ncbi:MAG: bifunctional indole-3-glycerol-phosphate synthase TrpC/phosphoribosylanthranilate isomerase TrpF [Candidatus Berkiella sp.]
MLNKIVIQQQKTVRYMQKHLSFEQISTQLTKSSRDFHASLEGGVGYIFECKHRSPGEGELRNDYDISNLAQQYATYGNALSVLTNKPFFGGLFSHLQMVSQVTTLPLLCKDIIVHPYQVALARLYQADAILLMLSVLDDNTYLACKQLAQQYNMAVITEVYTEDEMIRANKLKANIILINQRCLHTMIIDKERIYKLAEHFTNEAIIIGASGIQSHSQINLLKQFVNGFLIGSVLSKSNDVIQTMKDLIFGTVKVCGLTCKNDAQLAYLNGATYGGLIFAPTSMRKVTLEQAKVIASSKLKMVGVFVDQPLEQLISYAKQLDLKAIQLHGNESCEYISKLRTHLNHDCKILKAIDGTLPLPFEMPYGVDKIIVDNKTTSLGGTGKTFDWDNLKGSPLLDKIMLSGGISCENIIHAKKYNTWGIDVNSGVEESHGVKDKNKLEKFFQILKLYGGRHAKLFR